ncbi:hypothetical protein DM02DRAFT_317144 [Periconia macrospinosa]|uniref:Uncharacterized protein n=1 Tax=Periconia macrospinosa TaxID=97972 RepID=A0A2V1DXJ6_9PLEO|nr:hypothetical protein DM02DRAFT_317144 [Periconia macrospinosa]
MYFGWLPTPLFPSFIARLGLFFCYFCLCLGALPLWLPTAQCTASFHNAGAMLCKPPHVTRWGQVARQVMYMMDELYIHVCTTTTRITAVYILTCTNTIRLHVHGGMSLHQLRYLGTLHFENMQYRLRSEHATTWVD